MLMDFWVWKKRRSSIRDGRIYRVFSGFYRNAWYYLGNGRFLNQGSGGTGLTILGEYHLDRNGKLVCENYYFTHWDPAMEKEEVYWNTVGVPDRARSKKLAMNPAQFQELQKKRKDKVEKLSWQSLARYGQGRVILSLSGEGGRTPAGGDPRRAAGGCAPAHPPGGGCQ